MLCNVTRLLWYCYGMAWWIRFYEVYAMQWDSNAMLWDSNVMLWYGVYCTIVTCFLYFMHYIHKRFCISRLIVTLDIPKSLTRHP